MRRSAEEIAVGRWPEILEAAGIDPRYLVLKKNGPCPLCGGTDRFSFTNRTNNGDYICRKCGPGVNGGGRGFNLLMEHLGKDFQGACDWIRNWAGDRPLPVIRPYVAPSVDTLSADEIAKISERHRRDWTKSLTLSERDPVAKYLRNRVPGVPLDLKVIRFHPRLSYWQKGATKDDPPIYMGKHPAMIAAVQGPDDRVCNIHRTYLNWKGEKADVPTVRKMGSFVHSDSGAIRLFEPTGDELGVAEGIETALGAALFMKLPCWSVLSTDGMRKFELPRRYSHVRRIRLFADHDETYMRVDREGTKHYNRPGEDAAEVLAKRLREQGLQVRIVAPAKKGQDFNDLWQNIVRLQLAA